MDSASTVVAVVEELVAVVFVTVIIVVEDVGYSEKYQHLYIIAKPNHSQSAALPHYSKSNTGQKDLPCS
jgi:hypothetical protein